MTVYRLNFLNETPNTWTFCVYQEWPSSPGLSSVSWKQTSAPRGGETGVEWNVQYMACLADYKQVDGKGVFKAAQKLETALGQKWKVVFENVTQELVEDGATQPDQLLIQNRSGDLANPAIGMDGDIAMVKRGVYSGNDAMFKAEPTYYVALYTDLEKGEVISGNQVHGPLMVKFTGGKAELSYRASLDGANFVFEEVGNESNRTVAPIDEMERRVRQVKSHLRMVG